MDEKIQHFRSYKEDLITGGEIVIWENIMEEIIW